MISFALNRIWRSRAYAANRALSFSDWIQHPLAYILIGAATLLCSILIIELGIPFALILLCSFLAVPLLYGVIVYPKFGLIVLLTASYLIILPSKTSWDFPIGTLIDGLEFLLIIGIILKHKYDRNWDFIKNPVSVMIIVWISYILLEVLNPVAASGLAWIYTIRTVAIVMLTYFIFSYHITTVAFIRSILKVWIGLSVLAAIYTLKQEYFGFFDFEKQWLAVEPDAKELYFIGGHWRKFSFFSDPVVLAYNMSISSILCITLITGPRTVFKKLVLSVFTVLFIVAMLYSGTRAAFVLMPATMALLVLLTSSKKALLPAALAIVLIFLMIRMPTSNPILARFQSAFHPSADASFNVRTLNQKRIQPYIQSHPFGGGLGSTGVWGNRFSPNSYLASFPPDSGYVRIAVEAGWFGLLLLCLLFFIILRTGIKNYFEIQNPELKNYCLAMVLIVFALSIGNYPQEAFIQYPINIFVYLIIALITVTRKLDNKIALSSLIAPE